MPLKIPSTLALTGAIGLPAPFGPLPKPPVLAPEPIIINIPFVGEIVLPKPIEHPDYWPMPPIELLLPVTPALQSQVSVGQPAVKGPRSLEAPIVFHSPERVATAKEASVPESSPFAVVAERVAATREALGVREEGQKPSDKDLRAAFDGTKAPARQQEAVDARPTARYRAGVPPPHFVGARPTEPYREEVLSPHVVGVRPEEPEGREETEEDGSTQREPGDPEWFTLPEDDLYNELDGDLGPGALR